MEAGIDFGIEFPRFLIPFGTKFYSMQFLPHTTIKAGTIFRKEPILNVQFLTSTTDIAGTIPQNILMQ